MGHSIEHYFLLFSHDTVLIPLIVLGFIWLDRAVFYHATCLLLLSMLFNYALKITFQVPLPIHIGQGFAFPSGHMQQSAVFYGWLAYKTPNTVARLIIALLLIGIAYSLTYFGYHHWIDIGAAVVAAMLLIGVYAVSAYRFPVAMPVISIVAATVLLLYIYLRGHGIPSASWLAFYALLGFIFSSYLTKQLPASSKTKISVSNLKKDFMPKLIATLIALGGIFVIRYIFTHSIVGLHQLPAHISEIQWFAVGFLIPFSTFLAAQCCCSKHRK